MKKELGKIKSVSFGWSEYLFGLNLTLGGEGWGTSTGIYYNPTYKNESQELHSVAMLSKVQELLKDAKVETVDKLLNKPIEATFEGTILRDFRILTEVL